MGRIIHLDEHVSRVLSSVLDLADDTRCHILVLNSAMVSVLRQMVFPYVRWSTRLVEDYGLWQKTVEMPIWYKDDLDCLEDWLNGGGLSMTCSLETAINNLAYALQHMPSAGGAGCGSGGSEIVNCLPGYTDEQLLDTPPDPVDPFGETPPEGFETMEAYRTYKCQAAYMIHGYLKGFAQALVSFGGLQLTLATVAPAIGAILSALGVISLAFPPDAPIAIIAAIVSVGALSIFVFYAGLAFSDYLEDHKEELICALFLSGSAAEALAAIANVVEDFVQGFAWGATGAGEAFAAIMAAVQTNGLVAPLFKLVADIAFPGADCSCITAGCWHFDLSMEGFVHLTEHGTTSSAWNGDPDVADPEDQSPGCIDVTLTRSGGDCSGWERYTYDTGTGYTITEHTVIHTDLYVTGTEQGKWWLDVIAEDDTEVGNGMYTGQDPNEWVTVGCNLGNPVIIGKRVKDVLIGTSIDHDGTQHILLDKVCFVETE